MMDSAGGGDVLQRNKIWLAASSWAFAALRTTLNSSMRSFASGGRFSGAVGAYLIQYGLIRYGSM